MSYFSKSQVLSLGELNSLVSLHGNVAVDAHPKHISVSDLADGSRYLVVMLSIQADKISQGETGIEIQTI